MTESRLLQLLARDHHGILVVLHGFALRYNLARRNYGWAAFHAVAMCADAWAAIGHQQNSRIPFYSETRRA